jgi:multidrug efflux system membrane fusion protein
MSRFWKIALVVIALIVVGVVGYRVLHKPAAGGADGTAKGMRGEADNTPVPVTVVPVVRQNVPVYLKALGTVQALNTVTVSPQVAGKLLSLDFVEGQPVKKGQVLAHIDPRTYQAAYDQAVARQRQDQAQLATARSNLARSGDLAAKGYISKQDLDTLRNTANQLQAAVAADAAAARDSKVQLDYTKVIAPIDGLAGIRSVDPGNVVTTTSALVTLTQLHPINVMFALPEQNLDVVRAAVQADSTVKMQPVVIAGEVGDSHVMIGSGLKVGDKVVTEGQFRLKPGSKVNPLKPGEVPAAPTEAELQKSKQANKSGRGRH